MLTEIDQNTISALRRGWICWTARLTAHYRLSSGNTPPGSTSLCMGHVFFLIVFVAFGVFFISNMLTQNGDIASGVIAQQSSAASTVSKAPTSQDFNFTRTGTLVFFPNNVGPVPCLFYENEKGKAVAKALVFRGAAPPTGFSSWSAARVSVTGRLNHEQVIVSSIRYLSGP